jgi:hypothetical protein
MSKKEIYLLPLTHKNYFNNGNIKIPGTEGDLKSQTY